MGVRKPINQDTNPLMLKNIIHKIHINKTYFWLPILLGSLSTLISFTTLLYYNYLNPLTCLIIPLLTGFIALLVSNPLVRQDKLCQICLPWVCLVIFIPFSYWKLKVFIIAIFPIASLGGWLASKIRPSEDDS